MRFSAETAETPETLSPEKVQCKGTRTEAGLQQAGSPFVSEYRLKMFCIRIWRLGLMKQSCNISYWRIGRFGGRTNRVMQ